MRGKTELPPGAKGTGDVLSHLCKYYNKLAYLYYVVTLTCTLDIGQKDLEEWDYAIVEGLAETLRFSTFSCLFIC